MTGMNGYTTSLLFSAAKLLMDYWGPIWKTGLCILQTKPYEQQFPSVATVNLRTSEKTHTNLISRHLFPF
jgi:hypothetical protein